MENNKWKYAKVPIEDVVPAPMNANKMSEDEQNRLTKNIKLSGLSSVITCYKRKIDGKYEIISGHHRVKSCIKLGYKEIGVLYAEEEELTKDEIIAIQTSHNSLHGTDDVSILKKLFEQIKSIEFKEFAYIDIDEIGKIDVNSASFSPEIEEYTVSLVLYKKDMQRLKDLLGIVDEVTAKSDLVVLADGEDLEEFTLEMLKKIKTKYDIRSTSIAFAKILELAESQLKNEKSLEYGNEEEKTN